MAEADVKRRRVFFILDSLEDDDVGEHVATLLGRLSRSRFEPRVLTLTGEGPLGQRIRDMRVTVHTLPVDSRVDRLLVIPRVRKMLARLEADLVHAFHHVSGAVAELATPRGVPVVRYVPRLRSKSDPLMTRLAGAMEAIAAHHRSVRFVVGSEDARALVSEYYGVETVHVVPECLDLPAVRADAEAVDAEDARVRLGLADGDAAVACITSFHGEAFVETLLGGFAMARIERPGLRLFLQGTGPAENRARWRAEELHLGDAVVFLRDHALVADLLASADAVVDTAAWPGPSRAALMAAAVGLPVLRWEQGREIGDPQAVPPRIASTPERFAAELIRAVDDPQLNEALRGASTELANASDLAAVVERWGSLYDSAADGAMRED